MKGKCEREIQKFPKSFENSFVDKPETTINDFTLTAKEINLIG